MSQAMQLPHARVVSLADFESAVADAKAISGAQAAADRIVADAQQRAAQILEAAEANATRQVQQLQNMSDDALQRFLDERAVEHVAIAIKSILDEHAKLKRDFDATTPWIAELVETAVRRIIGRMPEDEVYRDIIASSMSELRDRWDLVLRCHPDKELIVTQVISQNERLRAAFREVQSDRSMAENAVWIVSAQGVLECSIETQIAALLRVVSSGAGRANP